MQHFLILNSGSSSLKFSIFEREEELRAVLSGNLSGIAAGAGHFELKGDAYDKVDEAVDLSDHAQAIEKLLEWLKKNFQEKFVCVGHRIVHGGSRFVKPQLIDDEVVQGLEDLSRFAPLHLPPAIKALNAARKAFLDTPHVACFDTSFHRSMPERARMLPLTKELFFKDGVEKFGFHGLSYEFVLSEVEKQFGSEVAKSKLVIAHLGNGCSMAAVDKGVGVDTTMGFSPAGGLVMGTRSGDIDPGLLTYFASEKGYSSSDFVKFVNQKCGLKGLSDVSSDMQKLLAQEEGNEDARRAIEIFCYHARKHIGALSAVLGGLNALVFTGGIGENAAPIRKHICEHLGFLGVRIDENLNARGGTSDISHPESNARTCVIRTNEEIMIARHCVYVLGN